MSGIPLYDIAIPTFARGLKTLDHILRKGEEHAAENGLSADAVFFSARLIDDQKPLAFQVQNATRTVRVNVDRLTGVTTAPFDDNETNFEDLHRRIAAAVELLNTVDPAVANSRGGETVEVPVGGKPVNLSVKDAVLGHGIPNFIFHITTAYSILRAKGVPLGKADFISSFAGL